VSHWEQFSKWGMESWEETPGRNKRDSVIIIINTQCPLPAHQQALCCCTVMITAVNAAKV
jgi:hypothetical protein